MIPTAPTGCRGARAAFDDHGMGCVGVPPAQLAVLETTEDPDALRTLVEQIILADHATKEEPRS